MGCGMQHSLTAEAGSVLKQSLGLAGRRGHAHLTPLHVAATLLSVGSSSQLRTACLNSRPLQYCRALELCLNVALNRLPTTTTPPCLSNALIAALKRAQAHHRHQQQHPLITVKIGLQQLIISILDDPSVSRVMREAGFSSTAVKTNLIHSSFLAFSEQDIKLVLDVLLSDNERKNTVIVGDCESITHGLVAELMARFETAQLPRHFHSTRLLNFHLSDLTFMKREQVEMRLSQLQSKVLEYSGSGPGRVIVYLGDLKSTLLHPTHHYSPLDHVVAQIPNLFCPPPPTDYYSYKVCLMATATYQTYIKCQMRHLHTHWALHPLPLPSTSLPFTLHPSSCVHDSKTSVVFNEKEDKLNCCEECASNYDKEAHLLKPGHKKLLPSWLHSQKQWSNISTIHSNQSSNAKIYPSYPWWQNQDNSNNSMTPDSTTSISFSDSMVKPTSYSSSIDFSFSNETKGLDSLMTKDTEGKEVKITLALGNSSFGDSGQTTDTTLLRRAHICKLLQENVPWQPQTLLSSIAEAVFVDPKSAKANQNCIWLFMHGNDSIGKRRLARAITESAFGSAHPLLFNLNMKKKNTLASPCCEMLSTALKTHQQLVVLIENADFADAQFRKLLASGFETGKFGAFSNTEEEKPGQAIFILTNDDDEEDNDDVVFNLVLQIITETKPNLNHKRKAEWDLLTKFKSPRIEQKQEVDDLVSEQGNLKKKGFSRQSSLNNNINTLDLNTRAEEEEEEEEEEDGGGERSCMNVFLNSTENRFLVNGKPGGDKKEEMGAFFVSKIKECFGEVCGKQYLENFGVEEKVIEEMSDGCGSFTNRVLRNG